MSDVGHYIPNPERIFPMIDLTAIVVKIQSIIARLKRYGALQSDGEVDEYALGPYYLVYHIALGWALYINEIQVWNDW
jgi:hypothetical protein